MKNTHLLFLGPYISAAAASNGKEYPFRLLGSSPSPRQSAGATLTEHHKIVMATLRL